MITVSRDPHRGIGRFANRPQIEILDAPSEKTRVRVLSPHEYVTCYGWSVVSPEGLIYDGASIPDPLWLRLGHPLAPRNAFGLPHDTLYRLGGAPQRDGSFREVSREEADLIAWDAALAGGHSAETAAAIFHGLRLGGAHAWRENAERRRICGSDRKRLLEWC